MNAAEIFDRIFQELQGERQTDGSLMCLCPAHNDNDPSLHVTLVDNKILLHCFSGCTQNSIITALRDRNLWPNLSSHSKTTPQRANPPQRTPKKKRPQGISETREKKDKKTGEILDTKTFVDFWTYKDKTGKTIGHVVRFENERKKDIIPYFHRNQRGDWYEGFPKTPRPLYSLNFIARAPQDLTIWIVEGEKCAEALQRLPGGIKRLAVTSLGGTNAAQLTDWSPLAGRTIRIWPDNDKPGKKYAEEVKLRLEGLIPPSTIETVDVAKLGLKEKEDAFDWLQTHKPEELNRIPLLQTAEPDEPDFKILPKPEIEMHKIHGFASKFVKLAINDSEADPAAVLITFLVRFGVEIGRDPCFCISDTVHHGQLATVIVGNSALSRKGTSAKPVQKLFDYENLYGPDTLNFRPARHSSGPFSSGEGIIYAVRDPIMTWCKKGKDKNTMIVEDPGEKDKRLFVLDEEFAGVLANTKREGNTLSTVIRVAWDSGNFDPLTKNKKIKATGAHVGWVSHITNQELNEKMTKCEAFNGFANRILWIFSSRRGSLPNPGPMPEAELTPMKEKLVEILDFCRNLNHGSEITLSSGALTAWENMYEPKLMKNKPGLLGILVARSSAQVRRLAMLFALLDKQTIISTEHLNQAVTVWEYSLESARYIFDVTYINPDQKKIRKALEEKGELTKTEISNLFGRHLSTDKIGKLLSDMVSNKIIKIEKRRTKAKKPVTYLSLVST